MTKPTSATHVLEWEDAFRHRVPLRIRDGHVTGTTAAYARWRGLAIREIVARLRGFSWHVLVRPA